MSTATAANKIVRALRAAHLRDAPRGELLRLACEKLILPELTHILEELSR